MDASVIIGIIAIFALVAVAAFVVFRRRARVNIKGPLGTELDLDASNDPPSPTPGVTIEDAKTRSGGVVADDETGRGATVRRVEAEGDILASSAPTKREKGPKE